MDFDSNYFDSGLSRFRRQDLSLVIDEKHQSAGTVSSLFINRFLIIICFCLIFGTPVAQAQQQELIQVVVYQAKTAPWSDSIEALGTLRANETVSITSSVTDIITKINFDDGQRVEKGFVLAEMTDTEESALVQEMTARLGEAKRQFDRLKNLPNSGAVSESLYDEREREYRSAQAQLEGMRSRLADRLMVAPFNGVVGLRNISEGALVEPGDTITTLTDDTVMKLDFTVPALYLSSLKIDLPIKARSRSFPGMIFEGKVSGIDSQVDTVTRSITARAIIANTSGELKPGLLMNVDLFYSFREALVLPEEALIPSAVHQDVFIVNSDKGSIDVGDEVIVKKQRVEISSRRNGRVEIVSGLAAGDYVITHGTMSARDGKKAIIQAKQEDGEGIKEILNRVE